jgi:predicted N-acetyltransferase YhbS
MIRERIAADLGPLCTVVRSAGLSVNSLPDDEIRQWLEQDETELSWVFDMAPVPVTPTSNVVGHVQVRAIARDPFLDQHLPGPLRDCLTIGKLFVRRDTYEAGIGRFLLRECVRHVHDAGSRAILDVRDNGAFPEGFYERNGFRPIASEVTDVAAPLVHWSAARLR